MRKVNVPPMSWLWVFTLVFGVIGLLGIERDNPPVTFLVSFIAMAGGCAADLFVLHKKTVPTFLKWLWAAAITVLLVGLFLTNVNSDLGFIVEIIAFGLLNITWIVAMIFYSIAKEE